MTEPSDMGTIEEAELHRQRLTLEVQTIQAQLGDRRRVDEHGKRLTSNEYWQWKRRATHALNRKLEELRAVKSWIKDNREEDGLVRMIGQLAGILDRAVSLGFCPTQEECDVLSGTAVLLSKKSPR